MLVVFAALFAIGAAVAAVLMSLAYLESNAEREMFARDGVAESALVTRVTTRGGDQPRRVLTYQYSAAGRPFTGTTTRRIRSGDSVVPGDTISIVYLRSRPDRSWTAGDEPRGFPVPVIPAVTFSLLGAALAIGWAVRRQWILLSEGRVARGTIKSSKKVASNHGGKFRLTYEFDTLSGSRINGRCDASKGSLPAGSFVPVIYHRDNPSWSAIYPLQLVRPQRR